MNNLEIKFTDSLIESRFSELVESAVRYAIISIPFTYDRLGIRDLHAKILNIAKGKLAEQIFFEHCRTRSIAVSTNETETPFYTTDKRDFVFRNFECDVKNNFLEHENEILDPSEYLELPCLVPNRGPWDQWSKRSEKQLSTSNQVAYLFTFMKKSNPGQRGTFFDFHLSFKQEMFIRDLYDQYQGKRQQLSPFSEQWFYQAFENLDNRFSIEIKQQNRMALTAVATSQEFHLFSQVLPSQIESKYLHTIIENMGCKVFKLPSFSKFFEVQNE